MKTKESMAKFRCNAFGTATDRWVMYYIGDQLLCKLVQSTDRRRGGLLVEPFLVVEPASFAYADDARAMPALIEDAIRDFNDWSADVGKRWDGNQVVKERTAETNG